MRCLIGGVQDFSLENIVKDRTPQQSAKPLGVGVAYIWWGHNTSQLEN